MGKPRVFISHSHKDNSIAQSLVSLLKEIGIKHNDITATSDPRARLHAGTSLYSGLRSVLTDKNVFVIFLLSDNFYSSTVCMNEMGAVWAMNAKYHYLVLPGFSFSKVEGVILERNQIGISLSTFDDMTKGQLIDVCKDLVKHFNLSVGDDTIELGLIHFASSLKGHDKQSAVDVVLKMSNVKSYCIGDLDNDGCRIWKKESSASKTTAILDFEQTTSTLCSIVYRVENQNWSSLKKAGKLLCFEAYSDAELFQAEVELHFENHNEVVPILIDDDTQEYRISLTQFAASEDDWKNIKEVCLLFRKKHVDHRITVVVENLRLEG